MHVRKRCLTMAVVCLLALSGSYGCDDPVEIVELPETSANFQTEGMTLVNTTITPGANFSFAAANGVWKIFIEGGGFTGTFESPGGATDGQFVVTHLSSASAGCQGGGYSPVTISANGSVVVADWDAAENNGGTHNYVVDTFAFPIEAGTNTFEWTAGDLCTHYWIHSIVVETAP